jgi:hypothetical protein
MDNLDKLLNQLQSVVQKKHEQKSREKFRDSSLYDLCNEGLTKAMSSKVVSESFCGCLDKAVEELGVLKGIRAIMSQMIRTVGDMVEHIEGDDNFCEADQAIIEMVVDFGLSEIAKICKQKLDEEI